MDSHWAFSSPGWAAPASSPSLQRREPLMAFVALCWAYSCVLMLFSPWGAQHMGAVLQMHLSSAEWKSHISQPFCNILPPTTSVGLFFCHKNTLLTHVQLVDCQDAQIPLCQAAFQLGRPQIVLMWGFIPPQVQDLAFFRRFLSVQFSSLSASLWTAAHASGWSTTPPSFVSSAICINVHKLL